MIKIKTISCANCERVWKVEDFPGTLFNTPSLPSRLDPGSIVPSGECPDCGALCHPDQNPAQQRNDLAGVLEQLLGTPELGGELHQYTEGLVIDAKALIAAIKEAA